MAAFDLPRRRARAVDMVRLQPHLATCVANLPDSTIMGMEGFKWTPPNELDVWTDNWFLRQEAETWQKVMVARPYARDREGNVCEFTVLHADVCPLDHGLAIGWVQVFFTAPRNPFYLAFKELICRQI